MKQTIINWIKNKFHVHQWEDIGTEDNSTYECSYSTRPYKITRVYIQRCKICNKIRTFKIDL